MERVLAYLRNQHTFRRKFTISFPGTSKMTSKTVVHAQVLTFMLCNFYPLARPLDFIGISKSSNSFIHLCSFILLNAQSQRYRMNKTDLTLKI
jgi:hypothetical protein